MIKFQSRKLYRKFLVLLLLLLGLAVTAGKPRVKSDCPICPEPYHCVPATGECVCDDPDLCGGSPTSYTRH